MENEDVIKIVIADGDYMEAYAPLPRNKEEADRKVKKEMLKNMGMKAEEINRVIDDLELEFDDGADGMFDDGPYTPIKLVKTVHREPPMPPSVPDPIPEIEEELEEPRSPRQTMLQQFYGDRAAESRRRKIFDRFKSHIVQKEIDTYDEDGTKKRVKVYTIEDYEGKSQDSDELLLDGYQTRLERLSRAHQRDFSPYKREFLRLKSSAIKEIIEKYKEMHQVDPDKAEKFKEEASKQLSSFEDPDFEKKAIQALIDRDIEFIETNNYTYNSRQNTAENLKTLGKDGEESVKAQVSVEQSFFQKAGLHTMNALIEIRNHTKAPVNKAIGTYVASPIFRALMRVTQSKSKEPVCVDGYLITPMEDILATSQKHSRGMFKNKPTHRYHARKDYFIEQEKESFSQEQESKSGTSSEEKGSVPRTSLGKLIRLAIVPRVKSIVNYREGNVAILNAGLHDIEEATNQRTLQLLEKKSKLNSTLRRIASYEKEIEDLKALENVTKDPKQKEIISKIIEQRETYKLTLEGRYAEVSRTEIDSVSTDAISMSQHDKANKANMSKIVRGFKTAGRAAAGAYISKYIYEQVAHQGKTEDVWEYVPGEEQIIEEQVVDQITETVPGMDKASIGDISLGDIYSKGSGRLSYYAQSMGNEIEDKTEFFRGLAFDYNGKLFSGSDGKGFDPTVLTNVKIDQVLDEDTSVVSVIQEIMQDRLGQNFSTDQIEKMILDGEISGIDIWRSVRETGTPNGWLNASQIVPQMIEDGTHEVTRDVITTVTRTITTPGEYVLKPGVEYTYYTTELNPVVVAAEEGLAAMEIADWNELLRFTRSQESIHIRQPKTLELMKKENDKIKAEKAKAKNKGKEESGKEDSETTPSQASASKVKKKREIKAFQRNNKRKERRYTHFSDKMKSLSEMEAKKREGVTIFEGFVGTRKDFKSGYDENLLGTNDREKPIMDDERE